MNSLESEGSARKPLPVSIQDFQQLRQGGYYYVDKTRVIKTVMQEDSSVLLITRPRRFGKTLFMDTLARFLRFEEGRRNARAQAPEELFAGLNILKDRAFCDAFMGRFPVIFISLKGVYGKDFKEARKKLAAKVFDACASFACLQESPRLTVWDKQDLRHCMDKGFLSDPENETLLQSSLQLLAKGLFKHHGRPVVLLITTPFPSPKRLPAAITRTWSISSGLFLRKP